jgi:TRAP-type C4-dicarboxylate transport system substrate-binding protein
MGDTAEVTAVAYQRIYERMLAKADEHKGVVVLSVFTHGPGEIYNVKRAINSLKDFDGLKIRVGGGVVTDVTKALGAVPILKPAPESYELLSSGVADGVFFPKESPLSFKFIPLIKYVTLVPGGLYNTSFVWMANPAKWNSIPEADRRLIAPLLGEALARRSGQAWDVADAKGLAAMQEAKLAVATASPALVAEIRAKTSALEGEWIEKKAKPKGVDGAAVLKALRAEIASLQKK